MKKIRILEMALITILVLCTLNGLVHGKSVVMVDEKNNLLIAQVTEKDINFVEVGTNGNIIRTIYSSSKEKALGYPDYYYNNMILFTSDKQLSIYNVKSKKVITIPNSACCYPVGFYKNKQYIVFCSYYEEDKAPKVYVYNYSTKKLIKTFEGYSPTIASADDTLYYMKLKDLSTSDMKVGEVTIYSYIIGAKDPVARDKVHIDEEYTYSVTEISAQSKDLYTYRIYDEHEYRYYFTNKNEQEQFYDGGQGTSIYQINKEQYNLVFSDDKKSAAFTERNWGELTYLVYVDLNSKKRITTKNFGSFPYIKNSKAYYHSDPSFVNTKEECPEFRQIQNYAIYEYDPKTQKNKKIIQLKGMIQLVGMNN